MKIGDRNIRVTHLLKKVIPFARILWGLRTLESPLEFLSYYMKRKSPDHVKFKNGLRISLSSNQHDIITIAVVFLQRDYGTVDEQSVVMDIGANIGTFALYAAKCGAAKVYAVEPNKLAFDVLCKNIKDNNFEDVIYPTNCAISDTIGQVGIPKNSSPYNRIVDCGSNSEPALTDYDIVAAETLGSFVNERSINHIDLLKMDCEGAEFSILPSFSDDIWNKISKIRMEYHRNPTELINLSQLHDFRVVRLAQHSDTNGDLWLSNGAA